MKKAIMIGIGIVGAIFLSSVILQDPNIILALSGLVALVSLLIAGALSGALVSGDRNRANFHVETKKQRQQKTGMVTVFTLVALPNLLAAILAYIYIY